MSVASLVMFVSAIVISALELLVGFSAGWMVRGERAKKSNDTNQEDKEKELEKVRQIVAGMHDLAADMASDVGQHAARVEQINHGLASADGDQAKTLVNQAVHDIVEANEQLQLRLQEAEERLHEQAIQLKTHEAAALTDPLTGINNRRAFDGEMHRRVAELARLKTPSSLAMIDVDFFKKFNDTHGHQAGDAVLKGMARTLTRTCREVDVVCRYGGEEFAVIMPGTNLTQAKLAAERVRKAVEAAAFTSEGKTLKATISIGIAELNAGELEESIVKRADEALYAAKHAGRNRGFLHDTRGCYPVVEPQPATPSAEELAEAERRKFSRKQRIALYEGGPLPAAEAYFDVQCQEISIDGLSFLTKDSRSLAKLVVALGTAPNFTYMAAEVVKRTPVAADYGGGFRVDCRFTHRFSINAAGETVSQAIDVPAAQGGPST